ncbi:MAG: flagellar biosynthesis protein FlhF [Spirochaetales bacterium]|nr:flagellar biosynthesis protein FlhF [Spirochaetales bacterium]
MQYFTLQANNLKDAIEKMKHQYGEKARILTHRGIRKGGVLGFFSKEGIEITGYLSHESLQKNNLEEEKKKILESARKEQSVGLILKEIQSLKESINTIKSNGPENNGDAIRRLTELLRQNDFTAEFIEDFLTYLKNTFSYEELKNFKKIEKAVIEWICGKIKIHQAIQFSVKKPIIFIIVGPTGVGKTTTIAKLAAIFGLRNRSNKALQVRMITIDNYRIAAKKQIETYAEIMQIPVNFVESHEDLKKLIAMYQDVDLILIDTIGKSPQDFEKLAEMRRLLSVCGNLSDTHLAISATTKASDIEEIIQQFEPFKYKSIILTKLDETSRIGNVISVLCKKDKPVSYIADGQGVPQDIKEATVTQILMKLEGLRFDREVIEHKYGKARLN